MKFQVNSATLLKQIQHISGVIFDDVLETNTTYSFNPDVLNRVGDKISQIIMSSKLISDEDKANLIVATSKTTIKKGTIEKLMDYDNPTMMFELIEPIVALK